ncbi:MAG: hypothetical protein JSV19_01375, partial [Phycisphaerales bacterium]
MSSPNPLRSPWCTLCSALIAAAAALAQTTQQASVTDAAPAETELRTAPPGDTTTLDDMPDGLRRAVAAALEEDAHAIQAPADHHGTRGYEAVNRANGLLFSFDHRGVGISPRGDGRARWSTRMTLSGIGYKGAMHALPDEAAPQMRIDGNRIEYHHHLASGPDQQATVSVVEWYVNDRRGLEQGFTLAARPGQPGNLSAPLCLDLVVAGNLTPVLAKGGSSIRFVDDSGAVALRYGHLLVFDARGSDVPAWLRAVPGRVSIVVNDQAAVYPLTVDPLFEVAKLTASDAAAFDRFAHSVSVSGDIAIVGVPYDDHVGYHAGSAYVFQRDHGGADNWGRVTRLLASDPSAYDLFGYSVSVSGDTAVVGARRLGGAAYIFRRDQGGPNNWGQVAKLTPGDGAGGGTFGATVSLSGDTAIVGAWGNNSAYIFQRDHGGPDDWGQVAKLAAFDTAPGDCFGFSVCISGDTAVAGAFYQDEASNDAGAAYIFQRDHGGPDNWGQVAKLIASDAAPHDYFGGSVSISGDTAIAGTWGNDSAYVFQRDQGGADNWGQVARLTTSNGAFAYSVSISGDTALVGAPGDESAYIFGRDQGGADNWGQVAELTASDGVDGDRFGHSVFVSGDTAIMGAPWDDDASHDAGSAYLFERDQGGADNWGQIAKLTLSDAAAV